MRLIWLSMGAFGVLASVALTSSLVEQSRAISSNGIEKIPQFRRIATIDGSKTNNDVWIREVGSRFDESEIEHHFEDGRLIKRQTTVDGTNWTPRTRTYELNVTYGQAAPDGFLKRRILINGQSPGPLIEANEGDSLVIKVNNFMDVGTSMHWHGMYQNSTPFMDGIQGFSQCPIPANGSLTYKFKIDGQFGTYWYHSHASMQYTDGMYGPLVVRSKRDPYKLGIDYDEERVIMLNDNYHDWADDIITQLLSVSGYNGSSAAPSPQSGLINGVGVFDCSLLARHKHHPENKCTKLNTPTMNIESGKKYRFRFINTGSHAQHIVSIDGHELTVIGADGTPTEPAKVHQIPLHNGQRHDAIVHANQGHAGDSFLLRSTIMTSCFAFVDPMLNPVANLTLQYVDPRQRHRQKAPVPKPWPELLGHGCVDLKDSLLVPLIDKEVPPNHNLDSLGIFTNHFGVLRLNNGSSLGRFFVDHKTHLNYVNKPYLEVIHSGSMLNSSTVANVVIPDHMWVADIVLNNADGNVDHPFHLHGPEMHIIARGEGAMTMSKWKNLNANGGKHVNLKNPLRRDTIVVPRSAYAVIRIITDLPGVWPLHCHIAMHVASGLMAAVAVHPEKIRSLAFPQEVLSQCPTHGAILNQIVPA